MTPKPCLDKHEAMSISDSIRTILNHKSVLQAANLMHEFMLVSHSRRMW
jgi:hypothetical protein